MSDDDEDYCGICEIALATESEVENRICDACIEKYKDAMEVCFICGEEVRLDQTNYCVACGHGTCPSCPVVCQCAVEETLDNLKNAVDNPPAFIPPPPQNTHEVSILGRLTSALGLI